MWGTSILPQMSYKNDSIEIVLTIEQMVSIEFVVQTLMFALMVG